MVITITITDMSVIIENGVFKHTSNARLVYQRHIVVG